VNRGLNGNEGSTRILTRCEERGGGEGRRVGCMRLMQILETTCGPLEIFNFCHKSRTRQNSRRINQPANNST